LLFLTLLLCFVRFCAGGADALWDHPHPQHLCSWLPPGAFVAPSYLLLTKLGQFIGWP
jgi:hypothetical protein